MDEEDDEDFSMLVKNLTGREFSQRQKVQNDHEGASRRSNRGRNTMDWKDSSHSHSRSDGRGSYQKDVNRRDKRKLEEYRNKNTRGRSMEEPKNRRLLGEEYWHYRGHGGGEREICFSQHKKKHQVTRKGERERDQGRNDDSRFSHEGTNISHKNYLHDQARRNGFGAREEKGEEEEDEDDDDEKEREKEEERSSTHSYPANDHQQNIGGEKEEDEEKLQSGNSCSAAEHHKGSSAKGDGKIEEGNRGAVLSDHRYCVVDHYQNNGKRIEKKEEEEEETARSDDCQSFVRSEEKEKEEKSPGSNGYANREEEDDDEEEELHHLQNFTPSITTVLNHKPETCYVYSGLVEDRSIDEQKTSDREITGCDISDDSNTTGQKTSVQDHELRVDRSFISCDGGSRRRQRSSAIRDYPQGCGGTFDTAPAMRRRSSAIRDYPQGCGGNSDTAPAIPSPCLALDDDSRKYRPMEYSVDVAKCSEDEMPEDLGDHSHGVMHYTSFRSSKFWLAEYNDVSMTKQSAEAQKLEKLKMEDIGSPKHEEMNMMEEGGNQKHSEVGNKEKVGKQKFEATGNVEKVNISVCASECRENVTSKQQKLSKEIKSQNLEEMIRMEELSLSVVLEDAISVCSGKSGSCSMVNQVVPYVPTNIIVLDPEEDDATDYVQVIDTLSLPNTDSQPEQKEKEEMVFAFPSFQRTSNITRRQKLQFKRKVIVLDDDSMDRAVNQSAVQVVPMDSLQVSDMIPIPESDLGTLLPDNDRKLSIFSSDMKKDTDEKCTPLLEDKKELDARIVDSSRKRPNIIKKPKVQYLSELPDNTGALVPFQNNPIDSSLSGGNGPEKPTIHYLSDVPNTKALVPFVNSRNVINKTTNDVVKMCSQRARSRINHSEHSDASTTKFKSTGLSAKGLSQDEGMSARALVKRTLHEFESLRREYVKSKDSAKSRRSDLEAGSMLRQRGRWQNQSEEKIIGEVPGIEVGDQFSFRIEMLIIGLHRQLQGGIDYIPASRRSNGSPIATSIVASGGYEDDKDSGDKLIYSGQGGNNYKGDKRQGSDQSLVRGNLAMSNCMKERTPVRVIRGTVDLASPSSKLYTYDGLYDVVDVHFDSGAAGFGVYQFTLIRRPGQPQLGLSIVQFVGNLKKKGLARPNLLLEDISHGQENWPVCVVNEVDGDPAPTNFIYIAKIKYPIWFSPVLPRGCDCEGACSDEKKCICALKNGGELPYNEKGYIIRDKKVVYECGTSCRCSSSCSNRVSQKGLRYQLEVFKTKNRGWGVRSVNPIQPGGFICEYTGELLSDVEAEERVDNDEYLFDLGNNCNLESSDAGSQLGNSSTAMVSSINEDTGYTIDAKCMGNVARFINHSCSPNLFAQNVLYDSDDLRFPHVMLFAMESIPPMRELTYDYNYTVDQVHDASGNIKKKACYCGAPDCKGRLY